MSQASVLNQLAQLENPDSRISLSTAGESKLLELHSHSYAGICSGDTVRFSRVFWEVPALGRLWSKMQSTVEDQVAFGGCTLVFMWEDGRGTYSTFVESLDGRLGGSWRRGGAAWGRQGIAVSSMRNLPVSQYTGALFDNNTAVIIPKDPEDLPAIWSYCSSSEFNRAVRAIDQKLNVTNATLVKVPFDIDRWQKVANERYPDGLPEPHSDDPTQWLFKGDIPSSTEPLQVAIARLLGYRWPDQVPDRIDDLVDDDGIVTLAPLVKQDGAEARVRAILEAAYESEAPTRPRGAPEVAEPRLWDGSVILKLLTRAGSPNAVLEEWLRDKFFEAHCKIFQQRPFIWHIWDGRKDGFHAFVNYHKLDRKNLENLTHVYLGDWIERQKAASESGDTTADGRLAAALELQRKLELIRIGEPPYDIFVRWKPLQEQPMGWEPDLNDGVRMNIRPFIEAGILRSKVNVNWNKDRGKDPKPNVSGTVERHNDLHFTLAQKMEARETAKHG